MTWEADWPWIVMLIAGAIFFAWWEDVGLRHGARTHTLSMFMHTIGARWPLSIWLFGGLCWMLATHLFWPWCPDGNLGVGWLVPAAHGAELRDHTRPDPVLTPGVTRNISLAEVCATKWDRDARAVTSQMKREVFRSYGLRGNYPVAWCHRDGHGRVFEIDHLVSRELGGADDVKNLWPECYSGEASATVKDKVENRLHKEVCAKHITLEEAQHDIRTDWRDVYRRYFLGEGEGR